MGNQGYHHLLVGFLILACLGFSSAQLPLYGLHRLDRNSEPLTPTYQIDNLNRSSFPRNFVFGAASSAYQIEGAWNVSGKGLSNWDNFTHQYPEKIIDRSNGDVATDAYHRYQEDVLILDQIGFDSYRFSLSWARILPRGRGKVNPDGIRYYNDLISALLAKGIKPSITLFHWDLPQALEDEYGGFLSHKIVDDFRYYADVCFKNFGDRVKQWATFNEPWSFSVSGYDFGTFPPGRCSSWAGCAAGNSSTEPYLASHHQLLAHSAAVQLYRQKYKPKQKGEIGIVLVSTWMVPYSRRPSDVRASRRALDFMFGWFMNPITYGDYPITMRALVGDRLPKFTAQQSELLKGSFDFLGLNYYTAYYAQPLRGYDNSVPRYTTDNRVNLTFERHGKLIGEQAGSDWLHVYPQGIFNLLDYIRRRYQNPPIYIMENGVDELDNATIPIKRALIDNFRIRYHHLHLEKVLEAIKVGVNVTGYFVWSNMDNFEWANGYTVRFGITYVNFRGRLERYPKLSAKWFQKFLKK